MTGYPGPDKPTRADYDVAPAGQTTRAADQMGYTPPPPVPPYPAQPGQPYGAQGGVPGGQQYPGLSGQNQHYNTGAPTGMTNPLSSAGPAVLPMGQPQPGHVGPSGAQPMGYHGPVINANTNKPVPHEMHQEIYVLHTSAGMPVRCTCPSCGSQVITDVKRRPGVIAMLTSVLCCAAGCWPCFFLPFCTPGCMARVHKCPRCHKIIAVEP